jgi:hypothetical protein
VREQNVQIAAAAQGPLPARSAADLPLLTRGRLTTEDFERSDPRRA